MAKDSVGTHDSVSVGLERTPPKPKDEPLCPKCQVAHGVALTGGGYRCSNGECAHTFTVGN